MLQTLQHFTQFYFIAPPTLTLICFLRNKFRITIFLKIILKLQKMS